MADNPKKNNHKNKSKKQTKDKKETLADYVVRRFEQAGMQIVKKELPEGWCRVFFKP